jgi:hypothetical protein
VGFLFRDNSFPTGCVFLTGTGTVPPDTFTLNSGDEIAITIGPIGTTDQYGRVSARCSGDNLRRPLRRKRELDQSR